MNKWMTIPRFVKFILPLLIISMFLLQAYMMFIEHHHGIVRNVLNTIELVEGGPIKYSGDSTVIYHIDDTMQIPYRLYRFFTIIAVILCIIDVACRKRLSSIIACVLWSLLLLWNLTWTPILLENKLLLAFPVYYVAFITMQFFSFKNAFLSVSFGIYIFVFLIYTASYIKICIGAIKTLRKS